MTLKDEEAFKTLCILREVEERNGQRPRRTRARLDTPSPLRAIKDPRNDPIDQLD